MAYICTASDFYEAYRVRSPPVAIGQSQARGRVQLGTPGSTLLALALPDLKVYSGIAVYEFLPL